MLFVDGENLAIRFKELAKQKSIQLNNGPYYEEDTFVWMPGEHGLSFTAMSLGGSGKTLEAIRSTYYTSVKGDDKKVEEVKNKLWQLGFQPEVFKKNDPSKKAKGVDIALTKDMLSHAFLQNYDVALLVAGDGDYVPLVQEVKRVGKIVCVAFFVGEGGGLNEDLRRASDTTFDLTGIFLEKWGRN